ncbi:hypothetical protein BDY21DRAFT_341107 [Lineolata rhizophorae]|uniref:Uncharacterized protein n=1 Tax=Lineolata rhizophorae TaxID=578093 RepID=A0A6A6P5J8_9PEZI|nr:hypothetical protein BDY21DRAFT_341107 [Lineolata rhizophorae]
MLTYTILDKYQSGEINVWIFDRSERNFERSCRAGDRLFCEAADYLVGKWTYSFRNQRFSLKRSVEFGIIRQCCLSSRLPVVCELLSVAGHEDIDPVGSRSLGFSFILQQYDFIAESPDCDPILLRHPGPKCVVQKFHDRLGRRYVAHWHLPFA